MWPATFLVGIFRPCDRNLFGRANFRRIAFPMWRNYLRTVCSMWRGAIRVASGGISPASHFPVGPDYCPK